MPINAIILAAGEGTRMKSAHPKVTHKLLEKPLIWWPVHAAREAQFGECMSDRVERNVLASCPLEDS